MTQDDKPLIWKGQDLKNLGDIHEAVAKIILLPDAEAKIEAQAFLKAYRDSVSDPSVVDGNIGYMSGYFDTKDMKRIQVIFAVSHPVFGTSTPTPEEAFNAGVERGRS